MLLTIVMPSYNQGKYIEAAIRSILAQKSDEIEFIIIDGGSTDESVSILERYSEQIDFWVSEPDKGQSDAFNKGFGKSQGQYVTWVNSDDLLLENSISRFIDFVRAEDFPDWVAGNSMWIDPEGKILRCTVNPGWSDRVWKMGAISVSAPSSFFKRELLERSGWIDETLHYAMDTDLWFRFASMGVSFATLDHFIWALRLHEEAKVSGSSLRNDTEVLSKREAEAKTICNKYDIKIRRDFQFTLSLFMWRMKRFAKFRSLYLTYLNKGKDAPSPQ